MEDAQHKALGCQQHEGRVQKGQQCFLKQSAARRGRAEGGTRNVHPREGVRSLLGKATRSPLSRPLSRKLSGRKREGRVRTPLPVQETLATVVLPWASSQRLLQVVPPAPHITTEAIEAFAKQKHVCRERAGTTHWAI